MAKDSKKKKAHEARGRRGRGPTRQREEGGNGVRGEGGSPTAARTGRAVNPTAVPRLWSGSVSTEWWQSTGGGRGSRRWVQFVRWTLRMADPRGVVAPAAVRSSVRPYSAMGEVKMVPWDRGEVVKLKS
jgi:hypothetical protein